MSRILTKTITDTKCYEKSEDNLPPNYPVAAIGDIL